MRHLLQKRSCKIAGIGAAALLCILTYGQPPYGQNQKLEVVEIARETQKFSAEGGELNIIWWLPQEFWTTSIAENTNMKPAQIEMLTKFVHPYLIVGVVSGKISTFGPPIYRTESEIRALIRLKDNNGTTYTPIETNQLEGSVPALESLMRPSMAKMLGPLGENMNFIAFPGSRRDGSEVCDASKRGVCEVDLGEHEFKWKLPLESVLPKQKCPVCGEILSGAYKFCPYDGTKLPGGK
jgi:hypothetical protein